MRLWTIEIRWLLCFSQILVASARDVYVIDEDARYWKVFKQFFLSTSWSI